ncbi:MAG: hypothetical protein LBE01_06685 [Deltaproteobacteria bacterium]|jgi:hypothetical protein|nr:hypothetical protein [Deltaproteobacteria bacterium]
MLLKKPLKDLEKEGLDLSDRFDCYGNFDFQDLICVGHCALSLSCAICKNLDLCCRLVDDKPRPELSMGWRDLA